MLLIHTNAALGAQFDAGREDKKSLFPLRGLRRGQTRFALESGSASKVS
jgi:hypothetical protein